LTKKVVIENVLQSSLRYTICEYVCVLQSMVKASHGVEGELFQELMQQAAFCQRAAQCSVNREGVLQDIKK
jgi:hypothetical protein